MEERKGLICWIKEHKKELGVSVISIGTLSLVILGIKNREVVKAVWASLRDNVKQPTVKATVMIENLTLQVTPPPIQEVVTAVASNSANLPIEVSRHIRNLPEGWHPSPEKIAEALENNIILMDGQTWVESYVKGEVAT